MLYYILFLSQHGYLFFQRDGFDLRELVMCTNLKVRRIVLSLIPLLLFVLLGFVARGGVTLRPYPSEDFSNDTAYLVLEVTGKNTVKIQYKERLTVVKLIGIGASITTQPNLSVNLLDKNLDPLMRGLLLGEFVYLRFDANKIDTDGQLWAYLYRAPDGLFINLELIRQGYNRVDTKFLLQHRDLFEYYEKRALIAGKGRWHRAIKTDIRRPKDYEKNNTDQIVYVTRAKTKYHRDGCRLLVSRKPMKLVEVKKNNYKPCLLCNPAR